MPEEAFEGNYRQVLRSNSKYNGHNITGYK